MCVRPTSSGSANIYKQNRCGIAPWGRITLFASTCGDDGAFRFAERAGGGHGASIYFGPLRMEIDDHPWCDCLRDGLEMLRSMKQRRCGSRVELEETEGEALDGAGLPDLDNWRSTG